MESRSTEHAHESSHNNNTSSLDLLRCCFSPAHDSFSRLRLMTED